MVTTLCLGTGVACTREDEGSVAPPPVITAPMVELSSSTLTLTVGDEMVLDAYYDVEGSLTWRSSDESVLTVDQSVSVKALKAGSATVTATIGEYSATCVVTVNKPVLSLHFYDTNPTVKIGEEYTVKLACVSGEGLSVEWSFENTELLEIVNKQTTVVNGECTLTFKAKAVGETNLTAVVDGIEATVRVVAEEKFLLTLNGVQGAPSYLEVGNEYLLDYVYERNGAVGDSADIEWKVSDSTLAGVENGKLLLASKSGSFTLTGKAGDAEVSRTFTTYKAIGTVDDFRAIANDLTGNYFLKNDIDFEGGQVKPPIAPYSGTGATSATQWLPQHDYFDGVLDGNGYALKNYSPRTETTAENKQNALFGAVGENGVIKNLSLLGVSGYLGGSALVYCHMGRIENVYLEMSLTGTTTAINKNNPFAGIVTKIQGSGSVSKCIAVIDCAMENNKGDAQVYPAENYGAIVGYVSTMGSIEDCYAYTTEGWAVASLPVSAGSIKRSQVFSNGDMFEADYSVFEENGAWIVENGRLPRLKHYNVDGSLAVSEIIVTANSNVKFNGNITASGLYCVELTTDDEGITLADDKMLSIAEDVAAGTRFTLTITLFGDATKRVVYQGKVSTDVTTVEKVAYYDVSADKATIEMSEFEITGTPTAITLEGKELGESNFSIEGNRLTLSGMKSQIYTGIDDLGEKTLVIDTEIATYQCNIRLVSKVIRQSDITDGNPASLDAIFYQDEYKKVDGNVTTYNGYFVLGEDLTFVNTSVHAMPSIFTGTGIRFNGVFDGLGYTISNYSVGGNSGSMFTYLGANASIKNVRFYKPVFNKNGTNWYTQSAGILASISYKGATIENILVEMEYTVGESVTSNKNRLNGVLVREHAGTMKNCIVIIDDQSNNSTMHGYLAAINTGSMENSYVIAKMTGTAADGKIASLIASQMESNSTGTHTSCKIFENIGGTGMADFYADADVTAAIKSYSEYWSFDSTNQTITMKNN